MSVGTRTSGAGRTARVEGDRGAERRTERDRRQSLHTHTTTGDGHTDRRRKIQTQNQKHSTAGTFNTTQRQPKPTKHAHTHTQGHGKPWKRDHKWTPTQVQDRHRRGHTETDLHRDKRTPATTTAYFHNHPRGHPYEYGSRQPQQIRNFAGHTFTLNVRRRLGQQRLLSAVFRAVRVVLRH